MKPLVNRIPHNCHQGFATRLQAERAYLLAFAMGCVRVRTADHTRGPAMAAPTPAAVMRAFADIPEDYLGAEWHVVFKGRCPGVYPAWYSFTYSIEPTSYISSLGISLPLKQLVSGRHYTRSIPVGVTPTSHSLLRKQLAMSPVCSCRKALKYTYMYSD